MFAAKYPQTYRPLLRDLYVLCIKKSFQLHQGASPAEIAQPLPPFSTVSKHRTRRNAHISRVFMRFRTLSVTPGVGGLVAQGGTGNPAYPRPTVAHVLAYACSGAPVQSHGARHGMDHRRPRPPRLQMVRLQPEIPFRRPVGIINQHQSRVVLQSLGLQDHRLLVLPQEFLCKYTEDRHWQKQIPSRHEINPAKIAPYRGHRRPARKPQLPAPYLFRPDIRQNKIDRRRHRLARIFLQHPVRCAVRARSMRTHPKSIRNRLELFLFFMDAAPTAPIPRLVYKRPVRRVHQSNNSLVYMRRQLASQMRNPIFPTERRQLRRGSNRLRQPRSQTTHVHPKISVPLFARIMPRKNPLHFQFVLAGQRRDLDALPAASLEFPPVITAFDRLPIKAPIRKRNSPVRTRISHRKRFTLSSAPQNQRHFQKHCRLQMVAGNFRASQRRIPEVPQKSRIASGNSFPRRSCASLHQRLHRFAHRYGIVVHRVAPEQPASAAVSQQPRRARRIVATVERIQLRDSCFSVILRVESNDVRCLLLADPAPLAPRREPCLSFAAHYSLLATHFFRGLPWP